MIPRPITTRQTAPLAGFALSPETIERYETFVRISNAMQSQNRQAAFHQLIRDFGTSYFFYYSFGRVGLI